MPDSPSGVYTLPPSYKVANGDLTDASQHNPPFEDVQQALTNRLHRDGRAAWTGDQNANGKKLTNLADGTSPQDAATVGQAAPQVGDWRLTSRDTPGSDWLPLDGSIYATEDYPLLAPLMEPVEGQFTFNAVESGTVNNLAGIALGNSKYIAVGNGGVMLSSTDLQSWSAVTSGTTQDITSIRYANLYWVATLANGNVLISQTGNSGDWTEKTTGASSPARDAAFGGGRWIVCGGTPTAGSGWLRATTDFNTWSDVTDGTKEMLVKIVYGNSYFTAAGAGAGVYYSDLGTTWTWKTLGSATDTWVSFVNSQFIATGAGKFFVASTPDDWSSERTLPAGLMSSIAYGDGSYLATFTNKEVMASTDLLTWTYQTVGAGQKQNQIIYSPGLELFASVGDAGTAYTAVFRDSPLFRVPDDFPTNGWIKAR